MTPCAAGDCQTFRLLLGTALLIAGCGREPPQSPPGGAAEKPSYSVRKGNREVLRMREGPGLLLSTAIHPPPGVKPPPPHPFVTGAARDPMEEDALRRILDESKSFQDFVERLRKAGYEVRPAETP